MLSILNPIIYNIGYSHMKNTHGVDQIIELDSFPMTWTPNQQNKSHYSKGCTNEPISSGIYEEGVQPMTLIHNGFYKQ
jgi:hypothetical protein